MNIQSDPLRVLVVIVNWERPEDTIECILSIQKSNMAGMEILVVDNGSEDGSTDIITRYCAGIHLITLEDNLGFSGGYNAGIKYALSCGSPYILLLNNDTVVEPQTIPFLIDSPWDIAVPKIVFYDQPSVIWAAGARWRPFPPTIKMIGHQKHDRAAFNLPRNLDFATGCALMIKRRVLEVITGFDPIFENYYEDYDFCIRARKAGFNIGLIPDARIMHKVSQSLGKSSPRFWRYLGRNTVLFYHKQAQYFPGILYSAVIWLIARELIKGNINSLPHLWQGAKEGFSLINNG